jgi:hypothetical protein
MACCLRTCERICELIVIEHRYSCSERGEMTTP